jgi:two-component system phosphate regulon sensor histidine kinase PhoR
MIWPCIAILALAGLAIERWRWQRRMAKTQRQFQEAIAALETSRRQSLAQAETEKEALFNSMPDGVLALDAQGRIRLANRALGLLFQLPDHLTGRRVLEALRIHELPAILSRVSQQKDVPPIEITLPGIEPKIVEVIAAPVRDRDGALEGEILVFRDLTRVKKLENTRQEFVANVSHELRTPLSLIKGYIETLLDGAKDKPDVAERFLRTIDVNANRLQLLIEDLLTISRLESGKMALQFSCVNLRQAVDRCLEDFMQAARRKNVLLTNNIPADIHARADANRLAQVLSNLVDNAIKYGRAEGSVEIAARTLDNGKVEARVSDDGPGIPPDSLERVFERFYRVDKARSREQGGTGLGLSIVKHIVQSHGGRVWASSRQGAGSSFYFTLDAASPTPKAA